jgi:hypothetical protein
MPQQLEARVAHHFGDVSPRAREEIVDAKHVVALAQ